MELKNYQKTVIGNLHSYLTCLDETKDVFAAYNKHWTSQDVKVGHGGLKLYQNNILGTPHVCFKVPTGGGKTFLACASVKPIFEAMPKNKAHIVAWLVPSNAILEQTIRTLSDINHPYRQRLDRDFSGRVVIYTKEQLLNGQNFNPTSVREQLSVCILSYDSIRSSKKDGRKVYQENSQLAPFTKIYETRETLVEGIDDTALIQVLNQLSPVIIVDESHNAQSDLSVEMLKNLNPSFVLDLTATPKSNSNIISYTDARELKKENMVKLPVVVYNRSSRLDVIYDAIKLRGSIETQATTQEENGGKYIRPIVLFQAQPKGKDEDSTFRKIKDELINAGIDKNEIAIKTSNINEIKGVDLLSKECKIRYIITINALKEGWDCPFAYILATLANKTSQVDVEQIVGRVLRQPYATKHNAPLLNNSYVLTCSSSFRDTVENVIKGLNRAGFDKKDVRIATEEPLVEVKPLDEPKQLQFGEPAFESTDDMELSEDFSKLKDMLEQDNQNETQQSQSISAMIAEAEKQAEEYNEAISGSEELGILGGELSDMINEYRINEEFAEQLKDFKMPQFVFKTEANLFFDEGYEPVHKEKFSKGFTLRNADSNINFDMTSGDVYSIDISKTGEAVPKYQLLQKKESEFFKQHMARLAPEAKLRTCVDMICRELNKSDTLEAKDVKEYVERIIAGMTTDMISTLETSVPFYARKIKLKIEQLENAYREKEFNRQLDTNEVLCQEEYIFPKRITPVNTSALLEKSLYEAEATMNDFEHEVIAKVSSLENIVWWHRIIERKGFHINGFINHYPDFVLMTDKGNIVLVETKGDHLANDESKQKLQLGRAWQQKAGSNYKYFMVFKEKDLKIDGAYVLDEFLDVIQKI